MLVILFGLPGSGKNYIGEIFKSHFGFFFYDADVDLTPEIQRTVKQQKKVTDGMRARYYAKVVKRLRLMQKKHPKMVVSQSFPIEKYRQLFLKYFPDAKFVLVHTIHRVLKKRLVTRRHLITEGYARLVKSYFQMPQIKCRILNNNRQGNRRIIAQIKKLLYSHE